MGMSGYSGKDSQKLKWQTLIGPEKLTVFAKINIPELFENQEEIQSLWDNLLEVNKLLSVPMLSFSSH